MIELFIIADDFTGALDTGVQFAAQGVPTRVIADPDADLAGAARGARVLVLDAETRHLPPAQAYAAVYRAAARATALGVRYLFKKTDSALRGNIGAELTAAMRARGSSALPFLPALPAMGRVTRDGVHYADGIPVSESVFARDPFAPVAESDVAALIHRQCDTPVQKFKPDVGADRLARAEGILLFDAESDADLRRAGETLMRAGLLRVAAGCAGFGAVAQALLGLRGDGPRAVPPLPAGMLVICGSVNPITRRQLDAAEAAGFTRFRLTCAQKLSPGWPDTPDGLAIIEEWKRAIAACPWCMVDANDAVDGQTAAQAAALGLSPEDVRNRIAGTLGGILARLIDAPQTGALLITGGDTLLGCMRRLGIGELAPLCELAPGVVLSEFSRGGDRRLLISKSGGFGAPDLLPALWRRIEAQNP